MNISTPPRRRRRHVVASRTARYVLPFVTLVILTTGGAYAAIEEQDVDSFSEGVWWALSFATTSGFADVPPSSGGGRVVAGFLMLMGIITFALITAIIATMFMEEEEKPEELMTEDAHQRTLDEIQKLSERLERIEAKLPDR